MKITCVMPTTDTRRDFWPGAVRCFLEQTLPDMELLVLNETESPATPNVFVHPKIRYEWLPGDLTLRPNTGRKRNLVNALADGDIVAHFDDDDWSAPGRIRRQIELLESSGKPVVGFHELLYLRATDRTLWRYRFTGKPPYASGTSLCYYRLYWERHRFADKKVGEDSDFALGARSRGELASEPGTWAIVARAHTGNTFFPVFGPPPFVKADRSIFPKEFLELEGL